MILQEPSASLAKVLQAIASKRKLDVNSLGVRITEVTMTKHDEA